MTIEAVGALEDSELSKDDILDLLKDEPVEETKEEEVKETKEVDEEEEEKKEKEEDEEEEEIKLSEDVKEDEEIDLETPVRRKEILAKYPDIFKDFPYLEKAYYKEQKYTELFSTIDDAETASNKAKQLDRFENDLSEGKTGPVLNAVKQADPEGFRKIIDNYLPTLMDVDKDAYYHVVGGVIKQTIQAMVNDGKQHERADLIDAAKELNKFIFGSEEFVPHTSLTKNEDSSEKKKLEQARREFEQKKFDSVRNDLQGKVSNVLRATVTDNIDPRDSMTTYVKKNAVRESMESLQELIDNDASFRKVLDGLWQKAFESDFSDVSVRRIRSTYLSKAKTLLPAVIKKARREALQGLRERKTAEKNDRSPVSKERRQHVSNKPPSKDGRGMSTVEFFNSED